MLLVSLAPPAGACPPILPQKRNVLGTASVVGRGSLAHSIARLTTTAAGLFRRWDAMTLTFCCPLSSQKISTFPFQQSRLSTADSQSRPHRSWKSRNGYVNLSFARPLTGWQHRLSGKGEPQDAYAQQYSRTYVERLLESVCAVGPLGVLGSKARIGCVGTLHERPNFLAPKAGRVQQRLLECCPFQRAHRALVVVYIRTALLFIVVLSDQPRQAGQWRIQQ